MPTNDYLTGCAFGRGEGLRSMESTDATRPRARGAARARERRGSERAERGQVAVAAARETAAAALALIVTREVVALSPERFACSIRTPHRAEKRCETHLQLPATNRSFREARRIAGRMGSRGVQLAREFTMRAPV